MSEWVNERVGDWWVSEWVGEWVCKSIREQWTH